MTKTKWLLAAILIGWVLAVGCGQKGPLYFADAPEVKVDPDTVRAEETEVGGEGTVQPSSSQPELTY